MRVTEAVLVTASVIMWAAPGRPTKVAVTGLTRSPASGWAGLGLCGPGTDSAVRTAARALRRPAPCSAAGIPRGR